MTKVKDLIGPNKREPFEQWMRKVKPAMPLYYNDREQYYFHDMVQGMWMAWQAALIWPEVLDEPLE